jgi:hypothetical protein
MFYKVLRKQGASGVRALWVSPNKAMNEYWASHIITANEHKPFTKFFLHIIGLPRYLYQRYLEKERNVWSPQSPMEFVIPSDDWDKLKPISVKEYSKKELFKLSFASQRRRERHQKWTPGVVSDDDIDNLDDSQLKWKLGLKSLKDEW